MRKCILMILILVMAATGATAFAEPTIAPAIAQGKITVEGSATIKVKPDVAYISLGVQTEAKEVKPAQAQNAETMTRVIQAVKALDIADKDIQTSGFYMQEKYNYETSEAQGYTVNNNVNITVRNIELIGAIIDAAVDAGANSASSVQFNISDPSPHYQDALGDAIRDAHQKATAIADALDVTIGLPTEVTEQRQDSWSGYAFGNVNSRAAYDAGGESTPIQSGELEISAKIQVMYGY